MNAPEAVSIRCGRCGGTFGALPSHGHARCPYCAFDQPVSAELLADLRRYAGDVGRELADANQAYQRAAAWQQWADQSRQNVPRMKLVVPLTSGFTLLVAVSIPISQALGISPQQVSVVVTPFLVLPAFFLMGYVLWSYAGGGRAAQRATAGNVAVACPNCGAKAELVAGAPSQVCAYCRAALVASPLVMERGVDAAEVAHRRARLEEFRQERLGTAGLSRYDMTAYVPFFVGGSILLPTGGAAVGLSAQMLAGEEPYDPMVFVLWALALVIAAGLAGTSLWRRARKARFQRALQDLARQFPLQPIENAGGLAGWLNRHWPARYELTALGHGHTLVAAGLDAFGYPALLNANFSGTAHPGPRLHLLLSAHRREGLVLHPDAHAFVQRSFARCRELGFEITAGEAGILAVADAETVRTVSKNPEALHEIAPLLSTLAHAARAAGAVPAERAW